MSSKLPVIFFVILGSWLFAHIGGSGTGQSRLSYLQESPIPSASPQATPTIDRLAAPPTVENPTQADEGAQIFWLHCQPCHGDQGQGLTDEWRQQYPPEDQNCWESGCHGKRPYEEGFILPTAVPAVTSDDSLERFDTMGQVYSYISAAMPYQDPGHLTEEEYLAITAFLARAHDVWEGTPIDADNASKLRLRPLEATATPEPEIPGEDENAGVNPSTTGNFFVAGLGAGIIGSLAIIVILIKRRTRN